MNAAEASAGILWYACAVDQRSEICQQAVWQGGREGNPMQCLALVTQTEVLDA